MNDGYEPYEQAAPKAELSVKKALQLDPELAEAHSILATVDFLEDKVFECEVEARRAVELNPSLPDAHYELSNVAFLREDAEGGIKALEAAYRLDPARPHYVDWLGMFYFYLGRESEALQHWEKTAQLAPAGTYRNMSEYYLSKGNMDKARELYAKAVALEPTNRWVKWMKGFMAALSGDREGALKTIKEIEEEWLGATNLNDIGFIYFALGDLDSYFTYADRALDQHTVRYRYLVYCPLFAKAREDPKYQLFLAKFRKMIAGS